MEARGTPCPLCASTELATFSARPSDMPGSAERVPLRECRGCGLAWQHPRLRSFSESVERHSRKYAEHQPGSYFDPAQRRAVADTEVAFLTECLGRPARLLDVGAGDGTFVSVAADRGWSCVGIDPAGADQEQRSHVGGGSSRSIRGTLADLESHERFDAITLWDVVEHLEDPEPVLAETRGLLDEGGILVVETGNYQSADRVESLDRWWGYAADHRWYFSPRNLSQLLARVGYRHFYCARRVLRPTWKGKASYDRPSRRQALKRVLREPLSIVAQLRSYRGLVRLARSHPSWAGLGIVTIVAASSPLACETARQNLIELRGGN